jgi:hypothetical protein
MNKQHIESKEPSSIRMTLENQILKEPALWRKVHDSTKTTDGDTRKVITRAYELIILGEPTGIGIKFYYDYRQGGTSVASWDAIALKALSHQIKGDYDEKIIKEYIDTHLDKHMAQPKFSWRS